MTSNVRARTTAAVATTLPSWIASLAECRVEVSQVVDPLSLLNGILAFVDRSGGRCEEAELCQLKAELLPAQGW